MKKLKYVGYRFEYHRDPYSMSLHITERLLKGDSFTCAGNIDTALENDKQLYDLLRITDGASEVSIRPYEITVQRGKAFDRMTVLLNVLDTVRVWLSAQNPDMEMELELCYEDTLQTFIRQIQRDID